MAWLLMGLAMMMKLFIVGIGLEKRDTSRPRQSLTVFSIYNYRGKVLRMLLFASRSACGADFQS